MNISIDARDKIDGMKAIQEGRMLTYRRQIVSKQLGRVVVVGASKFPMYAKPTHTTLY